MGPDSLLFWRNVFDMQEILDESTLEFTITRDEVAESAARPAKRIRIIHLTFTSQHWQGFKWRHGAHLYLPDEYQPDGKVGIIGVNWQFFEEDYERAFIQETGLGTEAEFAEGIAVDLQIPILIFAVPGEDINGMHESDLMGYAMGKLYETGDFTWYGYYPLAKAYLRAITLLQSIPDVRAQKAVLFGCSKRGNAVCIASGVDPQRIAGVMAACYPLQSIPDVRAQKAVLFGCSKRGNAVCIASGVDPRRISGVMAACYPGGNTLYTVAMKFAQLGPDLGGPEEQRTGPGYLSARMLLNSLNTPCGLQMLMCYDPFLWKDRIKSSYLVAIGTNDEFFALGSSNEMIQQFHGDKAFLAVDNLPHTWVSEKHLAAWRMWLAHNFFGRGVPKVEIKHLISDSEIAMSAKVASDTQIQAVQLYYAFNKTDDWRFATWFSIPMKKQDDCWEQRVELRENENLAYYAEVTDTSPAGTGYVSSPVEIISAAGHNNMV
jgi:PhoPQ-activated pathogenicity-related protein